MIRNFTSKKQKTGELGEDIACKFLVKNKFDILERNYTRKWGEIDIIAKKGGKFYFIEVKSMLANLNKIIDKNPTHYRPEENMDRKKSKRMIKIIETYLISNRIGNTPWQVDLLVIYIDKNKRLARVKTLENLIL